MGTTVFYQCKYFKPFELVSKDTFQALGNQIWILFRPETLISLDGIRSWFDKPVTVNNWALTGSFQNRGFRAYDEPTGAKYSQHRLGNAFDLDVQGLSADEVRKEILDNKDHEKFKYITCLEIDISWVHFDCRNIPDRVKTIKP